ncbi:hypothetical protein K2P47_05250 [Patescibacteria group bacterium]|nr:hypothetical protein [Patescibacteria group bacterium]
MYYVAPVIREEQLLQELEAKLAEIEANPPLFEFSIVPNALETITISEPLGQEIAYLQTDFSAAVARNPRPDEEPATIFEMPVGDFTYIEYINNLPAELQEPLFQMHDELQTLTKQLGSKYEQTSLAERIGEIDQLAYRETLSLERNQPLVYPSLRVVEAQFIGEVLASQFPSNASFYRDFVNAYIDEGVAYGYYSSFEAEMARMLVNDYLEAAKQNVSAQLALQSLE